MSSMCSVNLEAFTNFKCSLQCSGNTCRKNMESLEHCATSCNVSDYQQCWQQGLDALQKNPNLILDQQHRKALMKQLQSYLKRTNDSETKNAIQTVRKGMH